MVQERPVDTDLRGYTYPKNSVSEFETSETEEWHFNFQIQELKAGILLKINPTKAPF